MATTLACGVVFAYLAINSHVPLISAEGKKSGSSETVGCFTCNSFNDSDKACQDPFNPRNDMYTSRCETGIAGRVGTFPAHFCIKMSGRRLDDNVEVSVRTCSLKSMLHYCGIFDFAGDQYSGCLLTCDKNGCNHGTPAAARLSRLTLLTTCLVALLTILPRFHSTSSIHYFCV